MQVYVPIWTFTEGLTVESKSIGVFRDPKSAFLALLKKGIDEGHILREIYAMNNIPSASFYDSYYEALDSLGGPPQKIDDVNKEMMRMRDEKRDDAMALIQPLDTTDKFASFLYEKYIADGDSDEDLEQMNEGLERRLDEFSTKHFVENFKGSVCSNQFF
jgi:hypothetical protein